LEVWCVLELLAEAVEGIGLVDIFENIGEAGDGLAQVFLGMDKCLEIPSLAPGDALVFEDGRGLGSPDEVASSSVIAEDEWGILKESDGLLENVFGDMREVRSEEKDVLEPHCQKVSNGEAHGLSDVLGGLSLPGWFDGDLNGSLAKCLSKGLFVWCGAEAKEGLSRQRKTMGEAMDIIAKKGMIDIAALFEREGRVMPDRSGCQTGFDFSGGGVFGKDDDGCRMAWGHHLLRCLATWKTALAQAGQKRHPLGKGW
jgi:hypothetical protein